MSPAHRMPTGPRAARLAARTDLERCLAAARCAVRAAGTASREFTVRELLLAVLSALDRVEQALRRLGI